MWSLSVASLGAMPPALHCIMQMHILSFSGRYALAELSDNHRTHLSQGIRGPSLHHGADVCRHKIYCMAPIHKVHYLCCEPATNPAKANLNHVKPCNVQLTPSMLNRLDAFQMRGFRYILKIEQSSNRPFCILRSAYGSSAGVCARLHAQLIGEIEKIQ